MKRSEGLGCQNGAGCGRGWLSNGFHICLALFAATGIQDAQWSGPCKGQRGQHSCGQTQHTLGMALALADYPMGKMWLRAHTPASPAFPCPPHPPNRTPAPGSWAPAGLHRLFELLMRFPRDSIWLFNCSGMGLGCFDSELVSFLGYSFR